MLIVPTRKRTGFTLVELLVVIAIIGVLIALLLPAVQQAREAARRMQCNNNLKQQGLAIHNFHDTFLNFPAMVLYHDASKSNDGANKAWGWGAQILPFMEQQALYDTLDVSNLELNNSLSGSSSSWSAARLAAIQTTIDGFRCPSDSGPDMNSSRGWSGEANTSTKLPATSNYVAVVGHFQVNFKPSANATHDKHSALNPQYPKRMADITDGTSNTMIVGERDSDHEAAYWVGPSNTKDEQGWGMAKVAAKIFGNASGRINSPPSSGNAYWTMASNHPGGVNVLFADGSVHFLSETIEWSSGLKSGGGSYGGGDANYNTLNLSSVGVYQKLGMRDDGQVISEY